MCMTKEKNKMKNNVEENKVSELEISYKRKTYGKVKDSETLYNYIKPMYDIKMDMQEIFTVILLDHGLNILGHYTISQGGLVSTIVDTRLIFGVALKGLATQIAIVHNHPTGNLRPSEEDIRITKKVAEIGKLLDIRLLDHIIITSEHFYSFADNGQISI